MENCRSPRCVHCGERQFLDMPWETAQRLIMWPAMPSTASLTDSVSVG